MTTPPADSVQEAATVLGWLRQMQDEIRKEGHAGWGNTLDDVILFVASRQEEITTLQADLEAAEQHVKILTDARERYGEPWAEITTLQADLAATTLEWRSAEAQLREARAALQRIVEINLRCDECSASHTIHNIARAASERKESK